MAQRPDFSKYPYRGIHSEVARRLGISRQAVRQHRSPSVKRMIVQLVKERQRQHQEYAAMMGEA